jgi:hypothetical protein
LAAACEIDVGNTIRIFQFGIACKAVEHKSESLVAFHVAGTLEIFIEHRTNQVLC